MNPLNPHIHARLYVFLALASASLMALAALFCSGATLAARGEARPGTHGVPYPNMPAGIRGLCSTTISIALHWPA
jgi:hypothetical protein